MTFPFTLRETESLPAPLNASKAAILRHGEKTREHARLGNGFDLPDLIRVNAGEIIKQGPYSEGDQSRAFEMSSDGRFRIYLSSLRTAVSNHMIAACELGHFVLHKAEFHRAHPGKAMVVPKQVGDLGEDIKRCKWEAVWFAQGLLMPEAEFMLAVETRGLEDAAALFAVTHETAKLRHTQILSMRDAEPASEAVITV